MSVERIVKVRSGTPKKGLYGKTMAEVAPEYQSHTFTSPIESWALEGVPLCPGKAFGGNSTFWGQRR